MNKLEQLLQAGFGIALENTSCARRIFSVIEKMQEEPFTALQYIGEVGDIITAVDNLQNRLYSLTESIRELIRYNQHNNFVMLPKLFEGCKFIDDFWNNPENYEGIQESLSTATKKPQYFAIVKESTVYHIPTRVFAKQLEKEKLQQSQSPKFLGFDLESQTYWIIEGSKKLFLSPVIIKEDFDSEDEDEYIEVDLEEKLKEVVGHCLGIDPNTISKDTLLGDELHFVEILMDIEEQLGCEIPDPEEFIENFGGLLEFVEDCFEEE